MTGRGTEKQEDVKKRLDAATREIECGKNYQYVVVNDEVEKAAAKIETIINAERLAVSRNAQIWDEVIK